MAIHLEDVKIGVPPRVISTGGVVNLAMFRRQVNKNIMAQRLDPAFVKAEFERAGYEMLSEYKNSSTPINFICPNGHKHEISWDSFRNGSRCGVCAGKAVDTEYVKKQFEMEGYQILSPYMGSKLPIKFICPNLHSHQISWGSFSRGARCGLCAKNARLTNEEVSREYSIRGYTLIDKYEKCGTKMSAICPNGHSIYSTWDHFKQGHGCNACSGRLKKDQDFIVKAFAKEGYKVIGEYKNSSTPIKFVCPKGHYHQICWESFKAGNRCGECNADNLYGCFEYAYFGRITKSINKSIKTQNIADKTWRDFFDVETIKVIELKIRSYYRANPPKHHVDHIVPTSWFDLTKTKELEACWDINNLRYLYCVENIARGNKMNSEEVDFMQANHPHIFYAASRNPHVSHPSMGRLASDVSSRPYQQLELGLCL